MNWDHAVSWGWGVWVSVSDIGRVGSGWVGLVVIYKHIILNFGPHSIDSAAATAAAAAAPGVETKRNQRR